MAFICKECADRVDWFYTGMVSYGICELCDRVRNCDDIKPWQPGKPEALAAIRKEREEAAAKQARENTERMNAAFADRLARFHKATALLNPATRDLLNSLSDDDKSSLVTVIDIRDM